MVYSVIETTCFGLYWPSSGFCNIEEESISAVKTVRVGLLIKRSLYQSPEPSVPSARAICKHREKIINREKSSLHRREEFSLFIIFSPCLQIALALGTEGSGD